MPEVILFGIISLLAIISAAAMLLMNNAVYSALCLIVVMVCISLLFLMLEAPFLAMVQIAVYAGAIMVLFLFVIMLLGAEKMAQDDSRRFRWQAPVVLLATFILTLFLGLVIYRGQIDAQPPTAAAPQLRIIHASPRAGIVDLVVNGTIAAAAVDFRGDTGFLTYAPGDYTIGVNPAGFNVTLASQTVTLNPGDVKTVIVSGEGVPPSLTVFADDLSTLDARSTRLVLFNAYSVPVSLVDLRADRVANDTVTVLGDVTPNGQASVVLREGAYQNWAIVEAANPGNVLFRLHDFELHRDTQHLMVFTTELLFDDGSYRPLALELGSPVALAFGSPQEVGFTLFTTYMLPFQLIAMVLLVAMVGAIVLTHKESARVRVGGRRKVSRPLINVITAQTGHDVLKAGEESAITPSSSGD